MHLDVEVTGRHHVHGTRVLHPDIPHASGPGAPETARIFGPGFRDAPRQVINRALHTGRMGHGHGKRVGAAARRGTPG